MKILKGILWAVLALVLIFFAVGAFLPKKWDLTRSVVINAPDSVIYHNVADFGNYFKWDPWTAQDSTVKNTITGTPEQPGHSNAWVGEKLGEGSQTITTATPFSSVSWDLKFVKPFEGQCTTTMKLEPTAGGTRVTWFIEGENKSTLDRWMGLTMGSMMKSDFDTGLARLKERSEKK